MDFRCLNAHLHPHLAANKTVDIAAPQEGVHVIKFRTIRRNCLTKFMLWKASNVSNGRYGDADTDRKHEVAASVGRHSPRGEDPESNLVSFNHSQKFTVCGTGTIRFRWLCICFLIFGTGRTAQFYCT